ncbi:MAG TPA: radical SAM protein [Anaerolineae bacterium]|nr:radical SAM protein [Anaerolineae bacterium]
MIQVLARVPLYQLGRKLGWPQMLPLNLTITPSPRCNSRCVTCNIWKKQADELRLEEWDKIFRGLGRVPCWVTISGGEPFLNRELVALCRSLYEHCCPGIINIPTNGLLHTTIPDAVEAIARSCPRSRIIINLSLDGVGDQHDRIRGVPGNLKKFEKSYRALKRLRCPNLSVGIHSVISTFNVDDIASLYDYAFSLEPDSYITEIAEERVELDTVGLEITPSLEQYSKAIELLLDRVAQQQFRGISKVTQAFRVEYYRLVKAILARQTQVIPCYAGWISAQIYADGQVWPCCVRADNLGNLRDVGYDFRQIWFSEKAQRVRQSIKNKECHCPLANASYTNMLCHYPTLLKVGWQVLTGGVRRPGTERKVVTAMEATG